MCSRMNYKSAGVDIEAGYKSVELMKKYVKETMRPGGTWRPGRIFGSVFSCGDERDGEARTGFRYGRCGNQAQAGLYDGPA